MIRIPSGYFEIRKKDKNFELWFNDRSEVSCGESRPDWTCIGTVNRKTLKKFGTAVVSKEFNGIIGQT